MSWTKNWFSNFVPFETRVVYQGIIYKTPEHMYQALKIDKHDLPGRMSIASCVTPGQAKRCGQKCKLRPDWEDVKYDVMLFVLRHRFKDNTQALAKLLWTKGDITEWNNWHDNIWGDCTCDRCKDKPGRNLLGKALMQIRKEMS